MNVISFAIWGDDPIYHVGLRENIRLAREYYPGWKVWVYSSVELEMDTQKSLCEDESLFCKARTGDWDGSFWRFAPASQPDVERLIVRDCDSRIGPREVAAVNEWIESGKTLHVMRDHIRHNTPILAGMWGVYRNTLVDVGHSTGKLLERFPAGMWELGGLNMPMDQAYLEGTFWIAYQHDCLQHDAYFGNRYGETRPFPSHEPLEFGSYVGEKITAEGEPTI